MAAATIVNGFGTDQPAKAALATDGEPAGQVALGRRAEKGPVVVPATYSTAGATYRPHAKWPAGTRPKGFRLPIQG